VNFFDYLDIQKQEDRQAFLIHGPARAGKSRFVQQACQLRSGLFLLDLLEQFGAIPNLKLRDFRSEPLQRYLLQYTCPPGTHTLLVDNGDFLFNTWSHGDKNDLIQWMRYSLRTPAVIDKTLILVVQTDGVFSAANLLNDQGNSRILALSNFEAL
jgi:hypothetical protein